MRAHGQSASSFRRHLREWRGQIFWQGGAGPHGEGQAAARAAILNRLAVIVQAVGSLEKVSRIVAVNGFVNAGPEFYDHPKVLNGASDLLVEAFGEIGRHSRTAVGVSALPLNVAVEISMVVEVRD